MARFASMFFLLFWFASPFTVGAQEILSLDDYFRGTGLEGQIQTGAGMTAPMVSPPHPVISPSSYQTPQPQQPPNFSTLAPTGVNPSRGISPHSAFNSSGNVAPAPYTNFGTAPNQMRSSPSPSSGGVAIDPITGLPAHMTSLGSSRSRSVDESQVRLTPFSMGSSGSAVAPSAFNAPSPNVSNFNAVSSLPTSSAGPLNLQAPPQSDWNRFPNQPVPSQNVSVMAAGFGPIVLDGRIEPLDSVPNTNTVLSGYSAPGEFRAPTINAPAVDHRAVDDRVASQFGDEVPVLTDFGELKADWLKELQNSQDDRYLDDLCISRKGYVVLEHWGYHAAGLAGRGDSLGISTAQANFTLSFPQFVDGLTVRPQIGFHALSGPRRTDMPGNLLDIMVEGGWMQRLNDRSHLRLAVTVGSYTDFDQSSLSQSVRVSGLAMATYEASEDLQYVLGAAYVNLANRPVLPIVGFVYHPHDDLRMDLIYPEAKISWRINPGRDHERWAYLSSSFFGRTWHVDRTSGPAEDVTYSDWRLGMGVESHLQTRAVWYLELGAAIGRELEYDSYVGDYNPGATGYLRGGFYY